MVERKKLILIDGHALAYREFFALERTGMKTSDNEPSWAVYGFFKALFDLLKNQDVKPDALGVAFDVGRRTFRTEKYEEYKANRETMPDSLKSQGSNFVNNRLKGWMSVEITRCLLSGRQMQASAEENRP